MLPCTVYVRMCLLLHSIACEVPTVTYVYQYRPSFSFNMQFLSMASFTAPSQVTLLYQTLSDGVGPSTTSVAAVVELPSSTNQEAEHVQLILDRFSGIGSIEGFPVVGSPLVYSLTPAGESEYMQQLQVVTIVLQLLHVMFVWTNGIFILDHLFRPPLAHDLVE